MLKFVLSDESGIDHRQFSNHRKYMLERATLLLYHSKIYYNLGIASMGKKAASGGGKTWKSYEYIQNFRWKTSREWPFRRFRKQQENYITNLALSVNV
jgi:hypothetical protein